MTFRRWKIARRRLRLAGVAALLGITIACGAALDAPASLDASDPNDALETAAGTIDLAALTVRTYDGSNEFVHPDAYVFPTAWHGRRYWFAATPYPHGDTSVENPSLFWATGADDWAAPPGVRNPLARPDIGTYLSDPDLQYDPARDELRLYYREVEHQADQILVTTSGDGQRWSTPQPLVAGALYSLISPAIVREADASWRMFTVDPGMGGCRARADAVTLSERRSADGLAWEAPTPVSLVIPRFAPWHWDVQYVAAKHEYWALVAAYPDGFDCSHTSVFFGRSADGTTWHMSPTPLLSSGTKTPVGSLVYRSTFHYHPASDAVTVWYSGARLQDRGYVYGGATARYALPDLLARVDHAFDVRASVRHAEELSAAPDDSVARAAFVRAFP
jgi:hypothetical protein